MLIYKPWRRRLDKRRLRDAAFESLPTHDEGVPEDGGQREEEPTRPPIVTKTMGAIVKPVQSTNTAGQPADA